MDSRIKQGETIGTTRAANLCETSNTTGWFTMVQRNSILWQNYNQNYRCVRLFDHRKKNMFPLKCINQGRFPIHLLVWRKELHTKSQPLDTKSGLFVHVQKVRQNAFKQTMVTWGLSMCYKPSKVVVAYPWPKLMGHGTLLGLQDLKNRYLVTSKEKS